MEGLADHVLGPDEIGAGPASGSFATEGMLIVPCSMKTIAGIHGGYAENLILRAAVKNQVPQEELPAKLIIISDMEFNACVNKASKTVFKNAKRRYKEKGYRLPEVVFWNVASRNRQQPVTKNEQGVVLVSGATPRIFSMVAGGNLSPYTFMMEVLQSERYAPIAA